MRERVCEGLVTELEGDQWGTDSWAQAGGKGRLPRVPRPSLVGPPGVGNWGGGGEARQEASKAGPTLGQEGLARMSCRGSSWLWQVPTSPENCLLTRPSKYPAPHAAQEMEMNLTWKRVFPPSFQTCGS